MRQKLQVTEQKILGGNDKKNTSSPFRGKTLEQKPRGDQESPSLEVFKTAAYSDFEI